MVKIDITKTELVWPGKYDEEGKLKEVEKINLPFQAIETINTSRADREKEKNVGRNLYEFFESKEGDTFEDGWKNKLIWGDNKLVMSSLLKQFSGKIDLIYIDPPFAVGADFSYKTQIGDKDLEVLKEQSLIEEKAYRDTWGEGIHTYLNMMRDRIMIMKDLLSDNGSLFIHIDRRVNSYIRLILNEVFGQENLVNELIWHYDQGTRPKSAYGHKHDTIFWFVKNKESYYFNAEDILVPFESGMTEWRYTVGGQKGKEMPKGKVPSDVWDIKLNAMSHEHLGYPTQKPEELLKRIIKGSSTDKSIIADFFCGSGTTLASAEQLGRKWIGCDLSRWAIHTTRKRLLEIENCKPFEILNLGKYERQYWQSATFGDKATQKAIYEYIAFILKLYKAEPLSGTQYIHGKKSNALIHIGAVDSPVTIDEINLCLEECKSLKQPNLHILGWEWEMGLNDLMIKEAKGKGINLTLLNIPREVMEKQAVDKGDVKFFELAHVDVETIQKPDKKLQIELKDFAMSNIDLIPEEVREKVKKWSDYIDYWAVDWDFQNDTFMNGWVSYRTKQDRELKLKSDVHQYSKPGKYRVMVKVVDIFGNDTSNTFEVMVK